MVIGYQARRGGTNTQNIYFSAFSAPSAVNNYKKEVFTGEVTMSVCKTEAITLRRTDYSDSSQIITFTPVTTERYTPSQKDSNVSPKRAVQRPLTS